MVANPAPSEAKPTTPRHVAIIMDGNGRWARRRALPRQAGHPAGLKPVRAAVELCAQSGVSALTLFAFSSENWRRPDDEVRGSMSLFVDALDREVEELDSNGIRVRFIGDLDALNPTLRRATEAAEQKTRGNTRLDLVVAVAYGGRWDIVQAARKLAAEAAAGKLDPASINEAKLASALQDRRLPERRSIDQDRRREASQQFLALGHRLLGALLFRRAVAGLHGDGAAQGVRVLRTAAAALRPDRGADRGRGLIRARIITGALFGGVLISAILLLPTPLAAAVLGVLWILGAWEWAGLARLAGGARLVYAAACAVCMLGLYLFADSRALYALLIIALAGLLLSFVAVLTYPRKFGTGTVGGAGFVALVPSWLMLVRLHGEPWLGPVLALTALAIVWAADIGAYTFGRAFGRIKLAPAVSRARLGRA
jgi:undecaprenyl diphosphate synthase